MAVLMKIDRLLGILTTLLRQEKVTAPYLAEKFEVSKRTISRDIDALCRAGFPIATEQGRGGGISIVPGYTLDRRLFTQEELRAILSGVRGLDTVSASPQGAGLADKLGNVEAAAGRGPLLIDLASHYQDSLTEKIALIKEAAASSRLVSFRYYYEKGESQRTVEPYYAVFRWGDWYLFCWCLKRRDFRLFKLSRLWELHLKQETFSPRDIPPEQLDPGKTWQENYRLEALFDPAVKYRLIEEYGPESFTVREDGRLFLSVDFTFYGNMLSWVLSFGDKAEVLAPEELRRDLLAAGKSFSSLYGKQDK